MNQLMMPLATDDRTERPEFRRGLWLAVVIAGHGLLLLGGLMGLAPSKPTVEPPRVMGMLVSPPVAAVAPPKPQAKTSPAKPRPKRRLPTKPKPVPPLPPAPPSERAVTAPPPPEAPTVPLEDVAPVATETEGTADATESVALAGQGTAAPAEGPPVELPRTDAAHLNNPTPAYPSLSRRFGEEGRVLLDVYILADGRVGEIRLNRSSGFARLDQAALETVRHWRYMPARRGSEAIPFWYVQPITFSLDR